MAVKRLVGQFEARGSEVGGPSQRRQSSPVSPPAKGRAKFIRHPLLSGDYDVDSIDGLPLLNPHSVTTDDDSTIDDATNSNAITVDDLPPSLRIEASTDSKGSVTFGEGLAPNRYTAESLGIRKRTPGNSRNPSEAEAHELNALLPTTAAYTSAIDAISEPTYVASQSSTSREGSVTVVGGSTPAPPTSPPPSLGPHKPIAATTIFDRSAAPLYLPHLDDHLATLPAPSFPSFPIKGKAPAMFPPMDRLAASGKSLEDLEDNSQVAPWWRNRTSIFGSFTGWSLALTGSSALASYYSLHGLLDTIQIFALILNTIIPHKGKDLSEKWKQILLGTIPNILALNLSASTLVSLALLLVFMIVAGTLLYFFYKKTSLCCSVGPVEGLQRVKLITSNWSLVLISFALTVLYLPLSTMAVHVLVWSEDLWVVPNPYVNATMSPPQVAPLGPADQFRDPLDFCWTTTMKRNQLNYAPVIVIISLVCVIGLTVWYPLYLRRITTRMAPIVDKYTELGQPRSSSDMDREYQRLLARDRNPLTFLFDDFRRGWANYESVTLFAKLTTLLLTAIVDPDNCLFRTLNRTNVAVARQILLLLAMLAFFLVQCILAPFLDPVNNASEWTSRLNYVLTSALSLAIALNAPGQAFLNGPLLYIIYIVTYGLSLYFAIINTNPLRRTVKRLSRRIDFSIDIFSPRIDITPSSQHTKRRIWQEAITALFLTSPDCAIPNTQLMYYAQAKNLEYPPYLYDFAGTPGERHVENLKILREVGLQAYNKGVALMYGPDHAWFKYLVETIQTHFIGPDCYWKDHKKPHVPGCKNYFGNAWWIPFPPTLVLHYDDGPLAVLKDVSDLEHYIQQNTSDHIKRRREIRMALRALDGKVVNWPYDHIQSVGAKWPWCCGTRYKAQTSIHFRAGVFHLKHHGHHFWENQNLGSGFEIELVYNKDVKVGGDLIGLNDDYDLTRPLAHFLTLNECLIPGPLSHLEHVLRRYRHHCLKECEWKSDTLTYRFLAMVYDRPREPDGLAQSSIEHERDIRVRQLMLGSEVAFDLAYKRLAHVSTSEVATWWYIFWDDLWRRNYDTISALQTHASDFNPHYPTSIAYTPLPRAALEAFLTQRGLFNQKTKWGDFFTAGFLNKLYLRLNDIVFHRSHDANIIHFGDDASELDMEQIDIQTQINPSTIGTGGGTDHDDTDIRPRPMYRWEGILGDKLSSSKKQHASIWSKFGVWFGVTPLWRAGVPSPGLALDVRLDTATGRYILLRDNVPATPYRSLRESKFV